MIFVFGSNLSGYHGGGAARDAFENHGAKWEMGEGLAGNSYALPTKGYNISYIPLDQVHIHVQKFIDFAAQNMDKEFQVTCVGCGLAGFKNKEIAPLFLLAPGNCLFDTKWMPWLGKQRRYWGTF